MTKLKECLAESKRKEEDIYEPLEEILGDNPNNVTYTYITDVGTEKIPNKYILLSDGRPFTQYNDQFLAIFVNGGYLSTTLVVHGKSKTVHIHKLMGVHFLINPDPENKTFVDHLNGDRNNNDISNLRWADESQNRMNRKHEITNQVAILQYDMLNEFIAEYSSQREAAQETNTPIHRITNYLTGKIEFSLSNDGIKSRWTYKEERFQNPPPENECKSIPDFPNYLITRTQVYSVKYKRYLKFGYKNEKYVRINLCKNNKNYDLYFHNLLAEAWLENKPVDYKNRDKWIVKHINGIKDDNRIENLKYVTTAEIINQTIYELGHGCAKKVYMLDFITGKFLKIFASIAKAARYFKIEEGDIRNCCKGKNITCHGHDFILEEDLKNDLTDVNKNIKNKLIKIRSCEQDIDENIIQDSDNEDEEDDTETEIIKNSIYSLGLGNAKKVHMLNFVTGEIIKTFESNAVAAKYIEVAAETVRLCSNGKTLFCKGYCFILDEDLNKELNKVGKNTRKKLLRILLYKQKQLLGEENKDLYSDSESEEEISEINQKEN